MEGNQDNKKFIDLESIIKGKNPRLLKILPRFIINYIRKIIHEDEINEFLAKHGNKYGLEFADAVIEEFGVKIKAVGAENIPQKGPCIFASNHPLGGLDALALIRMVGYSRTDIHFLVNDILLHLENLKNFFVPVNKHGRNSAEALELIEKTYASDHVTMIFPAGLVSRKHGKDIRDLVWKKSFVTKAKKYHRTIIPVFIDGRNTNFFYNLANWRKRLRIGANIEMFYLVNEMYKQKNKTITIIFGDPVSWETFDKSMNDNQWAQVMKERVYALQKK